MKKNNNIKSLVIIILTIVFICTNTDNAKAVSGSSIIPGSSKSGGPGSYECSKGFNVSASGGFTGYRLTVVKTSDKAGTFGEILYQNEYVRKGSYKYAKGGGATVYVNTKSKECKTRFGLINGKLVGKDTKDDCQPKWKQVYDDNKKYYNNYTKTTLLNGDYNWDKVAAYYNKKATDEEKTLDLLEKTYKIDVSKFTEVTVTEEECQDSNGNKFDAVGGVCKQYICPASNLLAGTTSTSYNPNVSACVSYGPAPYYVQPKAPSGHTYSNFNSATGTYTDTWIKDYTYSCSSGTLSGTKCILEQCEVDVSTLETDGKCHSCRYASDGSARTKYTTYSNGYCYYKDDKGTLHAKKDDNGNQIGRAQVDGGKKTVDATATPNYTSVTRQATEQECTGDWVNTSPGVCAFVHGTHSYTSGGKKVKSSKIEIEDESLQPVEVCAKGEEQLQYVWMIIEPMFTVATGCSGQKSYYGTSTEIATLVNKGSGFSNLTGETGMWGGFLYMVKDEFKNNDGEWYKFSKLISATKETDYNSDGWYKKPANMYQLNSNNKVKGAGVGIVWLGNAQLKKEGDNCKKGYFCYNDPNHSIQDCVSTYWKQGYTKDTALEICNRKECDDLEKCDKCTDEGRKNMITYTEFPTDYANTLANTYKDKDARSKATTSDVNNISNNLKTTWSNEHCVTPTFSETVTGNDFTCKNYYNNIGDITFNYNWDNTSTDKECSTIFKNKYGTKIGSLGNCNIFCKESAHLVFPGHVQNSIHAGDTFEWPSHKTTDYPMQIDYSIDCTAINPDDPNGGSSCNYTVDSNTLRNLISFDTNKATITYESKIGNSDQDSKYKLVKQELDVPNKVNKVKTNISNATQLYDKGKLTLTATYKYYLPEKLNFYIDSISNYFNKDNTAGAIGIPTETGGRKLATPKFSNLQTYARVYPKGLHLDVELGNENSIGENIKDYTCKYSVYETHIVDCVCPENTKHAGESLRVLLACEQENLSCTKAQEEFCNLDEKAWDGAVSTGTYDENNQLIKEKGINFKSCKCENCESKGKIDITDCLIKNVNELGHTAFDYCYDKKCKATCNENENKCADYKFCKYVKREPLGNNYYIAYKKCYPTEADRDNDKNGLTGGVECSRPMRMSCPDECDSDKIVFRTIDLENPFPGMNGSKRNPGMNWNNTNWVKNKITDVKIVTNGRTQTYKSNEIYNKKPLYSITLTPDVMNKIRTLNKTNDYAAYEGVMSCVNGGNVCNGYYVSKLLRDTIEFGGECKNANNSDLLKKCYDEHSSSSVNSTYSN